eukprot:Nk52_evm123s221 gene=Nk52_evmTU123s221
MLYSSPYIRNLRVLLGQQRGGGAGDPFPAFVHKKLLPDPWISGLSSLRDVHHPVLPSRDFNVTRKRDYSGALLANQIPEAGMRSTRMMRDYNEDRYIVAGVDDNTQFFGVFDGHGGAHAADFVKAKLYRKFRKLLKYTPRPEGDQYNAGMFISQILRRAVLMTDKALQEEGGRKARRTPTHMHRSHSTSSSVSGNAAQYSSMFDQCGTTAIVAVKHQDTLVVANVGDSRAVLCSSCVAIPMSREHSPDNEVERERIEKCGGEIFESFSGPGRVMGSLAMTRSIGDFAFREFGVIPEPEFTIRKLSKSDQFLVLASDGLFDTMSDQRVCDVVLKCTTPEEAVTRLVKVAEENRSDDNTTVIVLRLLKQTRGYNNDSDGKTFNADKPFGIKVSFPDFLNLIDKEIEMDVDGKLIKGIEGATNGEEEALLRQKAFDHATGKGIITEAAFRTFDVDGDGKIGYDEYSSLIKKLKPDIPETELKTFFNQADTSGDGFISYEEFIVTLKERSGED